MKKFLALVCLVLIVAGLSMLLTAVFLSSVK